MGCAPLFPVHDRTCLSYSRALVCLIAPQCHALRSERHAPIRLEVEFEGPLPKIGAGASRFDVYAALPDPSFITAFHRALYSAAAVNVLKNNTDERHSCLSAIRLREGGGDEKSSS